MNREAMEKWIAALEDPVNGERQIRRTYNDNNGGVCALGLAHEVLGVRPGQLHRAFDWNPMEPDWSSPILIRQEDGSFINVSTLNDMGESFWNIAQALRATHLKETT